MLAQQSQTATSSSSSSSSKVHAIRRAHSTPRLINTIRTYRPAADASALIASHLATTETSSGDEFVWVKPKGRAQFECNICFDAAREPVVTQCGHLYCWPCLHQWLTSPNIEPDPICPTCKSGCEIPSIIPIYGRGPPPTPPRSTTPPSTPTSQSSTSKKVPRALRFADTLLLPYIKSPSSASNPVLPPRPPGKRLPPRSILQNSPFYMLLQSAQQHYPFLPEGTVLAVPQGATTRFGRPHMFMLVFAIWAALFKMMADSGRSWRSFSASFDHMGGRTYIGTGAEGDTVGRFGLILGMFLGFGLLWYRSRHVHHHVGG